jgi:hypothetical protein
MMMSALSVGWQFFGRRLEMAVTVGPGSVKMGVGAILLRPVRNHWAEIRPEPSPRHEVEIEIPQ